MKISILLFIFLLAQQCHIIAKKNDTTHYNASQRISKYIQDSLSSFHSIEIADGDSSQLFIKKNLSRAYCCFSDFNGDKEIDYAILLRDDSNRISLVVFKVIKNAVSHIVIENLGVWEDNLPELRIEVEPKGIWEAIDEKIKVYHDGVSLTNEKESLTFAYYWKNNRFNKFYYD
jgi:hypothetical protein